MHLRPLLDSETKPRGHDSCWNSTLLGSKSCAWHVCSAVIKFLVAIRRGLCWWWLTVTDHDYLSSWASRRDQQTVALPLVASLGMIADLTTDNVNPLADLAMVIFAFILSLYPKHRLLPDFLITVIYIVSMVWGTGSTWYEPNNIFNAQITGLLGGMLGFHSTVVVGMCLAYILTAIWNSPFLHEGAFVGLVVSLLAMCSCCVMLEYRVACGVIEMMRVIEEATDGYFHCDPDSLLVVKVSEGLQKKLGKQATQAMQQRSVLEVIDQRDHAAVLRNLGRRSTETLLVTLRRQSSEGQRSTADCRFSFFNISWSRQQQICVQIQGEWRLEFDDLVDIKVGMEVEEEVQQPDLQMFPPAAAAMDAFPVGCALSKENVAGIQSTRCRAVHRPASESGSTASERAVENVHAEEVESVVGLEQLASLGQEEHWIHSSADLVLIPQKKLGEGSFGIVVAGRLHGTPIAVKLAKGAGASWDHRGWPELANEIRMLRRLRHPNIVGFFGACVDAPSGIFALLMELMCGRSLQDYVQSTASLRALERLPVVLHLCHALRHLHTLVPVVVHGDLKPSNVVVEHHSIGPQAKLLDFGLSRLLTRRVRAFGGSLAWRAPEVARGSEFCGTAADVFSLGRLCHYILIGRQPFEDLPPERVSQLVKHQISLPLEWPTLSPECARLWDACLTFDPILRPRVVEVDIAMTKALAEVGNDSGQLLEVSIEAAFKELCRPQELCSGISASFSLADETYPIEAASPDWVALFGQLSSVMEALPRRRVPEFQRFLESEFERRFVGGEADLEQVAVFKRLRFTKPADKSEYKATALVVFPPVISSMPSGDSGSVCQSFIAELKLENFSLHRLHRQQQHTDVLPTLTEEEF